MSAATSTEHKASDEMDAIPLSTALDERARAKAWMDTAAQHCRNEEFWRDRALKAEGWTGHAERDALGSVGVEMPYVIMDCRTIVGNTPLFWMPNGNGYGSVVSEIGRYSEAKARSKRETDYPVPLDIAIACARPRIDIQLLNRELEIRNLPVPQLRLDGKKVRRR